MSEIDYQESYFKLKKSNEELTTLISKVVSDFRHTKDQLTNEIERNRVIVERNDILEKQVLEIENEYDSQKNKIEDLKDEMNSLQTYSKAVEAVAEDYCEKNMVTEIKYKRLSRKSLIIMNKLSLVESQDICTEDFDEMVSPTTPIANTPDLTDVKKTYEDQLTNAKIKRDKLRSKIKVMKQDYENSSEKVTELKLRLEEKTIESDQLSMDLKILTQAYDTLMQDRDSLLEYFSPFLKLKSENLHWRRTSEMWTSDPGKDARIPQLMALIEDLKERIVSKDLQISELQSESLISNSFMTNEMTYLKLQLDESSQKVTTVTKERDTLKHENRILQEQKVGYGVAPPPPPSLPPAPPMSNFILKLFKGKPSKPKKKDFTAYHEDKKMVDMMEELQKRLEKRVSSERLKKNPVAQSLDESSLEECESVSIHNFVSLRSFSVPNINTRKEDSTELKRAFERRAKIIAEENDE